MRPMADQDLPGPIDYLLLQFPDTGPSAGTVAERVALLDAGVVRLFDLIALRTDGTGAASVVEPSTLGADDLGGLGALAGARSGMLGADDVAEAGSVMDPDRVAVLIVYENAWASPFVNAAIGDGGEAIASQRITVQQVIDALDAADAADAAS
jgi:hypothetical protein